MAPPAPRIVTVETNGGASVLTYAWYAPVEGLTEVPSGRWIDRAAKEHTS
jgi:hypothetical protein